MRAVSIERSHERFTMNGFESLQLQINEALGQLIHFGSSTSSTLAYGLGLF